MSIPTEITHLTFFTPNEPYNILLVIPILVSLTTTSKFHIKSLNVTLLFLFSFFHLQYIESYLIFLFILLYLLKNPVIRFFKRSHRFTDLQHEIFSRDFSMLTEDEFNILFENAKMVSTKSHKNLMTIGAKIEKVYYFASVPYPSIIYLKMKNTIISYIKEGSWIGIVEFLIYVNNVYHDKNLVELSTGRNNQDIVYFEWEVTVRNWYNLISTLRIY
jgi:hypothetical protein